jgi:hypothetical protein
VSVYLVCAPLASNVAELFCAPRDLGISKEFWTMHKATVSTSEETRYVSATETNRLMLFGETVAACYENHTEHINTPYVC